jgi:hypothetical protein
MADGADPTKCGCDEEFAEAFQVLVDHNPYNDGQSSAKCFSRFKKAFPNATALHLRAALWQCQDVNPLNSFVGFTYNGNDLQKRRDITLNFHFSAARSRNVTIDYKPLTRYGTDPHELSHHAPHAQAHNAQAKIEYNTSAASSSSLKDHLRKKERKKERINVRSRRGCGIYP